MAAFAPASRDVSLALDCRSVNSVEVVQGASVVLRGRRAAIRTHRTLLYRKDTTFCNQLMRVLQSIDDGVAIN